MKRIITLIIMILMLVCSYMTCFAADYNEMSKSSVYAKYNFYKNSRINTSVIKNKKGIVVNEGSLSVSVVFSTNDYDGCVLIVNSITRADKDAYKWIKTCLNGKNDKINAYEIYILDANNNRIELPNGTKIMIELSFSNQHVTGLSCEGKSKDISSVYEEGKICFNSSSDSDYYILFEKMNAKEFPQTGDTSNIYLWIIIFLISLVGLFFITKQYIHINKFKQ